MRPQHGYSLVELSFVLIIILVLAGIVSGAGAYLSNMSKGQKMIDKAREIFVVAGHLIAKTGCDPSGAAIYADGDTAILNMYMGPYLESGTTLFKDPWTGTDQYLTHEITVPHATTDYPILNTQALPTNYVAPRRLVWYLNRTGGATDYVMDQDGKRFDFKCLAIQALDNSGRSLGVWVVR